jgi:hypothetical protein
MVAWWRHVNLLLRDFAQFTPIRRLSICSDLLATLLSLFISTGIRGEVSCLQIWHRLEVVCKRFLSWLILVRPTAHLPDVLRVNLVALGSDFDHLFMLILGFSMMNHSLLDLCSLIIAPAVIVPKHVFIEWELKVWDRALVRIRKLLMGSVLSNLMTTKSLLPRLIWYSLRLLKILLRSHWH